MPILVQGTEKYEYGGCYNVVTLFFTKKSSNTTDWCVGALSWRRNQMLVLHFSWRFLLTASSIETKDVRVNIFTVAIPTNYTGEPGNIVCSNTCISTHSQFLYHVGMSGQYHFQAAYPRKEPRIHWIGGWVGPGDVRTIHRRENFSFSAVIRNQDRPADSLFGLLLTLSRIILEGK
jgi:ribosome modulation factor